jgi:hypothetical protein
MRRCIIALVGLSVAAAAPILWACDDAKKTNHGAPATPAADTVGATLVYAGAPSCASSSASAGGCSAEKTSLVSTGGNGNACPADKSAADKTSLVSTGGKDCSAEKASATLVSTNGADASKSACCPNGDKANGTLQLVSTDGAAAATDKKSTVAAADAKKAFQSLKSLAGRWESPKDAQGETSVIEFKVTANGSVVHETMFPGQQHEMVNTYALDGDRLLVTHYCAAGSQPRMALVSSDGKVMKFEFVDATNLKSRQDQHMGALELTLVGEDTINEKWDSFQNGEISSHAEFELRRVE